MPDTVIWQSDVPVDIEFDSISQSLMAMWDWFTSIVAAVSELIPEVVYERITPANKALNALKCEHNMDIQSFFCSCSATRTTIFHKRKLNVSLVAFFSSIR